MADHDTTRKTDGSSAESARPVNPNASGHSQPTDAGKTSGGGSLGHDQPEDLSRQNHVRNEVGTRGPVGGQREPPEPIPELEP